MESNSLFCFVFWLNNDFQMLLSIAFMAIGAANGLNDETLIVGFANNNMLGITVISGILTALVLYLVFKLRKKQVNQEWKLNKFKVKNAVVYTRVEKTTNAVTAIIVSSILFGFIHIMAGGMVLVIGAILMALVFGYIFYKFESLWVCIIAHAVANLSDFILYNKPDISGSMFLGLIIFFACLFSAGLYVIHKTTQNDNSKSNSK